MKNDRLNFPESYISYVKSWPKFKYTELLNDFPKNGIILHDTNLEAHLSGIGIDEKNITRFQIGTSMPGSILIIESTDKYPRYFIAEGLPGGSGISTLAAELFALGANNIVHIGLCALLGNNPTSGAPILSKGAHKDPVANLLSNSKDICSLAYPSKELNDSLSEAFKKLKKPIEVAYGYTTPLFYFQSTKLLRGLILGTVTAEGNPINYMEMEQSAFFQTAIIMKKNAASIVIGSDRYHMIKGEILHKFENNFDQDELEKAVLKTVLNSFSNIT